MSTADIAGITCSVLIVTVFGAWLAGFLHDLKRVKLPSQPPRNNP